MSVIHDTPGTPANGNGHHSAEEELRRQVRTDASIPEKLAEVAFAGEAAHVVVPSAEGVTMYPGKEADPEGVTARWIEERLEFGGEQNAGLASPSRVTED